VIENEVMSVQLNRARSADAIFMVSAMTGALIMSRIVNDAELSASILQAAKDRLAGIQRSSGCGSRRSRTTGPMSCAAKQPCGATATKCPAAL
jgi:hypothetical protein